MLSSRVVKPELENRLRDLLADSYSNPVERLRLAQLMSLFADLPPPPDPGEYFPRYAELKEMFRGSLIHGDSELIEERFLELYSHLHMHEAPYTAERLKRAAFFSMLEDWHLEDDAGATKLTRLWRDFEQHGLKMVTLLMKLRSR